MNGHQQPARRPGSIRTHVADKDVDTVSPALQGATSAFLPKAPTTTTSLSSVSASPISAGARQAARTVASHSLLPSVGVESQKDPSPERGRSLQPDDALSRPMPRSTLSSQSATSAARLISNERSPSTIAARYASSRSSSPIKSPGQSPYRYTSTLATSQNGSSLSPDASKALAGAIASMAASQADIGHQPVPVRNRVLDFERLPQISASVPHTKAGHNGPVKPVSSRANAMISRTTSINKPSEVTRGRTQSVSAVQLKDESSGDKPSANWLSSSPSPNPTSTTSVQNSDKQQRPPVPTRLSHKTHMANLHSAHIEDRTRRGLTVNGLADAMVASSLASSRAASPVKKPLPPASRRRSRSFPALYDISFKQETQHHHKPLKPPRPMKHTLRKRSEEEEDEVETVKRGRRHWVRKHPNKHHEGDRKRWRDKVTEAERKRYEGVFAANRGLFIGPGYFQPSPSALADNLVEGNKVANVIVRDLWERSRLPPEILMEVYDLVAPAEDKALNREQFVVGMWLVDQRLKGRKLPVKVSSSVWSSVRHPDGIQLKKNVM